MKTDPSLIAIVVGFPVLLYAFAMFDRIVKAQYEGHRDAWFADGRPRGFFWQAPECTWFRSALALHRLSFLWLFTTPPWVGQSSSCQRWLRRLRLSVSVWTAIIIGAVLLHIAAIG
jgi:hypothetical protein